jgi:hypothetical protein
LEYFWSTVGVSAEYLWSISGVEVFWSIFGVEVSLFPLVFLSGNVCAHRMSVLMHHKLMGIIIIMPNHNHISESSSSLF